MIDYREFDCIEDEGYDFFRDKDGVIYKVGLPKQKDLVKFYKLFYVLYTLKEEYVKKMELINSNKINESLLNKMDILYEKTFKVSYDLFLFILNLNTQNKKFEYEDIKGIRFENILKEISNYEAYIKEKTKN